MHMRIALLNLLLVAIAGCSEPKSEATSPDSSGSEKVTVYKSPSCGCCGIWVDHLKTGNFEVNVNQSQDLGQVKQTLNIDPKYQSCHTTVTGSGFVFEGHIPVRFIQQFLDNPPEGAIGLAVPGMPLGSPGMEMGDQFAPYDIFLLKSDGSSEVYARVNHAKEQFQ